MKLRILAVSAVIGLAVAVGACSSSDSTASNTPAPPPPTWQVTQKSVDGMQMLVDAISISRPYSADGCLYYKVAGDSDQHGYRIICGGIIEVKPEPK